METLCGGGQGQKLVSTITPLLWHRRSMAILISSPETSALGLSCASSRVPGCSTETPADWGSREKDFSVQSLYLKGGRSDVHTYMKEAQLRHLQRVSVKPINPGGKRMGGWQRAPPNVIKLITSPRILLFHSVNVFLSCQLTQFTLSLFLWELQNPYSLFLIRLTPHSLCLQEVFTVARSLKEKLELSEFLSGLRTQNSKIMSSDSSGKHFSWERLW